MRIYLTHENHQFCIPFPTRFFFSKTGIKIFNHINKQNGHREIPYIDPKYMEMIYKEVQNSKKRLGKEWDIVNMSSSTGDGIRIKL